MVIFEGLDPGWNCPIWGLRLGISKIQKIRFFAIFRFCFLNTVSGVFWPENSSFDVKKYSFQTFTPENAKFRSKLGVRFFVGSYLESRFLRFLELLKSAHKNFQSLKFDMRGPLYMMCFWINFYVSTVAMTWDMEVTKSRFLLFSDFGVKNGQWQIRVKELVLEAQNRLKRT